MIAAGSETSTGAAWLKAAAPRHAVISCGRNNRFGHPDPETLGTLVKAGVPVSRTDRSGMVTAQVRGGKVEAWAYVGAW